MTHEARGNPEQGTPTRRERIRDFLFRLHLINEDSAGNYHRRSVIYTAEGGIDPEMHTYFRYLRDKAVLRGVPDWMVDRSCERFDHSADRVAYREAVQARDNARREEWLERHGFDSVEAALASVEETLQTQ